MKSPDVVILIEAIQIDALREAASVVRDADYRGLDAADVLDYMTDSLLSPNNVQFTKATKKTQVSEQTKHVEDAMAELLEKTTCLNPLNNLYDPENSEYFRALHKSAPTVLELIKTVRVMRKNICTGCQWKHCEGCHVAPVKVALESMDRKV